MQRAKQNGGKATKDIVKDTERDTVKDTERHIVKDTENHDALLTVSEVKLYDRQIRLWGMNHQQQLKNSRILIINSTGLSHEIAKNLVLFGVGSLTIIASTNCNSHSNTAHQFLLHSLPFSLQRVADSLQALNPIVKVACNHTALAQITNEFFKSFDLVCIARGTVDEIERINLVCRDNKIGFWACDTFGGRAWSFCDMGKEWRYESVKTVAKQGLPVETIRTPQTTSYSPFAQLINHVFHQVQLEGKFMRKWLKANDPSFFALSIVWKFWKLYLRYPTIHCVSLEDKEYQNAKKRKHGVSSPISKSPVQDVKIPILIKTPSESISSAAAFEISKIVKSVSCKKSNDSDEELLRKIYVEHLDKIRVSTLFVPFELVTEIASHIGKELSATNAVLGGFVAQEIIKACTHTEEPFNNFFIYDAIEATGLLMKVSA